MAVNYLFLGNPGTGKSTLINCLTRQQEFDSGLSYGTGKTQFFQKCTVNDIVYMDTPGLSDVSIKDQAAAAITEALRQGGTYKLFFMVRLENGRVVSDDLATVEVVLDSIDIKDVPFSIIFNNVKKRQYNAMMQRGGEFFKVITLINSSKYKTPYITFIPCLSSLDEMKNQITELPQGVEEFITHVGPSITIPPEQVNEINLNELNELVDDLRDQLEQLRNDNEALRRQVQELMETPYFLETLAKVASVTVSAITAFLQSGENDMESLTKMFFDGDVAGIVCAVLEVMAKT